MTQQSEYLSIDPRKIKYVHTNLVHELFIHNSQQVETP